MADAIASTPPEGEGGLRGGGVRHEGRYECMTVVSPTSRGTVEVENRMIRGTSIYTRVEP